MFQKNERNDCSSFMLYHMFWYCNNDWAIPRTRHARPKYGNKQYISSRKVSFKEYFDFPTIWNHFRSLLQYCQFRGTPYFAVAAFLNVLTNITHRQLIGIQVLKWFYQLSLTSEEKLVWVGFTSGIIIFALNVKLLITCIKSDYLRKRTENKYWIFIFCFFIYLHLEIHVIFARNFWKWLCEWSQIIFDLGWLQSFEAICITDPNFNIMFIHLTFKWLFQGQDSSVDSII